MPSLKPMPSTSVKLPPVLLAAIEYARNPAGKGHALSRNAFITNAVHAALIKSKLPAKVRTAVDSWKVTAVQFRLQHSTARNR